MLPVVVADGQTPVTSSEPLGSFAIKTRGRMGKQVAALAAVHVANPAAAVVAAADMQKPSATTELLTKLAKKPLVLAGVIGGGAIMLGLIGLVVLLFASRRDDKQIVATAKSKGPNPAVAAKNAAMVNAEAESNPVPAGEERNPEAAAIGTLAEASAHLAADETPASPATSSPPQPSPAEPAATQPSTPEAKPEPKPVVAEPPPTPQPEPKPAAPPAVKPTPAKAPAQGPTAADTFKGFARAVDLPELPEAAGQSSAAALEPLVLGPCRIDPRLGE